jgi:outer membrane protein OmpA-like peptidoglycan-associated protein
MAKDEEPDGVPAFYQLFATISMLLLGFFVILNSLRVQQEAGGRKGVGEIRNAFGLESGFGLFNFSVFDVPRKRRSFSTEEGDKDKTGVHEKFLHGQGKAADVNEAPEEHPLGKYLVLQMPRKYPFEDGSTVIPEELADYLMKAGFALENEFPEHQVVVRSFCQEYEQQEKDRLLATQRAAAIVRYLNIVAHISYDRMRATGYATERFFASLQQKKGAAAEAVGLMGEDEVEPTVQQDSQSQAATPATTEAPTDESSIEKEPAKAAKGKAALPTQAHYFYIFISADSKT